MTTTTHRPVPLPPRAGQPAAVPGRMPLPAGAVAWSRTWLDAKGQPQSAEHLVPVDADGRRTEHVRYACRGHIEVDGVKQPCDHVAWLAVEDTTRFCPDHGCQLTVDGQAGREPILPLAAVAKAVEPSARPWWLLAAEFAAGIGEHAGHVPWWAPLAATPVLAGGAYKGVEGYLTRRAVRNRKLERGQRDGRRVDTIRRRARSAAYMGTGAGVWLTTAAVTDPVTTVGAVTWGGGLAVLLAASAPTWWSYVERHKNRPEPAPAPEPPLVEVKPSADAIDAAGAARVWAEEVAIPGTVLDVATWRRITCGWQAVVVATKRGALNMLGGENMKGTIRRIASAFDVPRSAVTWIEEHDDSPNKALLLIQPNNPLAEGQIWGGPDTVDIVKGVAQAGRFIDGTPMVEVLFKYGWGAPGEVVLGTTGGGKSERIRKRLVMERWASFVDPATGQRRGAFITLLHDPKRMEAYAEFKRAVHGYGVTRDDAHIIVDALLRECYRRYDFLQSLPWEDEKGRDRDGGMPWNPLVHGPIISHYWDEFHRLAGDAEFVKKLEELARMQRACAMRGTIASHMGTLGDTGSQALRDMLAGGRATLFRTTSGLTGSLVTGGQLTADPRAIPKVPGMCLVADGESPALMGRESWIPKDEDAAKLGVRSLYDWLFDDDNNPIGYPAVIPPETAEAFGKEFMEWMEAGRRPGGRSEGPVRASAARSSAAADAKNADDGLRRILFDATGPLSRDEILGHALWRWSASQLGKSLTTLKLAGEVGGPHGKHELTVAARERLQVERSEQLALNLAETEA